MTPFDMRNVLVLTYWSYSDALIQTYTLPYVQIIKSKLPPGSRVFLLTLEKEVDLLSNPRREEIAKELGKDGILWLPFRYKPFGVFAFMLWIRVFLKLIILVLRERI